jgi:hypothetical protein
MKIHYFKDGISDSSFASTKSMIMVDRQKFLEFDAVMQPYVNFKRTQKAEALTYQACNVSAVQGHGGGRQGHRGQVRGGQGKPDARTLGIAAQEEVDKVTTFEAWWYSPAKYTKFTPAKKQKLFQLEKAGKIPGTGPSRKTIKSSVTVAELMSAISAVSAAALAISELTAATTMCTAADGGTNDNDAATDSKWGRNRDNPAVAGRQECVPKKPKN